MSTGGTATLAPVTRRPGRVQLRAVGVSLRDVADDPGELPRARPHRPVARRQVDPADVAQLGETTEPRIALLDGGLDLLGREPRAHDRARHVQARVVGQLRSLSQCRARLGNGPPPERLELLLGEPVEVFLVLELLPRGKGLLDGVEVGIERARRRTGVDVHHGRDLLGDAVARGVAGGAGPAVSASTTGAPAALTASQIASTWSDRVIADRSASADSRPGSVTAVTSWPSARNAAATSSHAHAPSQNPGTRTIGAVVISRP